MKRTLAALLALLLALALIPSMAEEAATDGNGDIDLNGGLQLTEKKPVVIDLDGDGAQEVVSWRMVPGEWDPLLTLTVGASDGSACDYTTDILWDEQVYILDLDGDGLREILVCGDVMSSDYVTYCLRYADGALHELLFPDSSRGDENGNGYFKCGYGAIVQISGNRLLLSGSQDVLGTWFATRAVTLTPLCRFEFDDDGLWVRDMSGWDDESDLWNFGALTLTAPLSYTGAEGCPDGTLKPGDRIVAYASDKRERVWFATPDGTCGILAISPDYDRGWGWKVDGLSETDCFEYVPYAD